MDKKIIVLILFILLLVIIGGIIFMITSNRNNEQNQTNNQLAEYQENTISYNTNTNVNNDTRETGKILVLYFSQSGNTEAVANFIHDEVGGDIVKIETSQTYPSDYDELIDYAQEEQRQNARPELKIKIDNIDQYDTIFLGYPNWWGDMPMPIYTFLEEYDLSGKIIAPFITHGGSGLSGTPSKIKQEEPNATITEGLAINGSRARNSQSDVKNWLSEIDF